MCDQINIRAGCNRLIIVMKRVWTKKKELKWLISQRAFIYFTTFIWTVNCKHLVNCKWLQIAPLFENHEKRNYQRQCSKCFISVLDPLLVSSQPWKVGHLPGVNVCNCLNVKPLKKKNECSAYLTWLSIYLYRYGSTSGTQLKVFLCMLQTGKGRPLT